MRLVDTNILIYAADTSPEERQKRVVSVEVLKEEDLTLSVQVLQEFYHQATRPTSRLGMSHEQALAFLDPFMDLTIQPVTQLDFTHFKRHKRGDLQVDGTERPGLSVYQGRRQTVKNLPAPATGGAAP